jgi:putative ABC transport system permease protein
MMKTDKYKPPKIAEKIFTFILPQKESSNLLGDYEELYKDLAEEKGQLKAWLWYWWQLICTILSTIFHSLIWSVAMFSNYLKIALRNMKKQKGYTFINIFGLALGITCFIGIMMYVKYELSYDSFHEKSKRIFRVVMHWEGWNFRGSSDFASTNGAMATVLPHEFQEIESAIRVKNVTSSLKYQENSMMEQGLYADKDFFKTFTFPLISGDRETALEAPFSIVLTKELALKLFGEEDPIGKVVAGLRGFNFKVTGVCEEIPENSHLQFDFVMSFKTMYSTRNDIDTEWGILNYYNYVLLQENVQYKEFEKKTNPTG